MTDEPSRKAGISRRKFLAGLGLAGASLFAPASAAASKARKPDDELATLHDLSKCVGCGACVEACREANARKFPEPARPFPPMYPSSVKVEDWSTKRMVSDRLTPYNWLYIQTARGQFQGQNFELHIPRRCMHCQNPPCANLCPWGAAAREDNGIVRIDPDICLGGAKCKNVCPWEIPMRQTGVGLYLKIMPRLAGNGVMFKCDRCADRVAQGLKPACIDACPYGVQEMGPRGEMVAKAHALARNMGGYIYGETDNGGTNSLYVSPVPFDVLDAAVTTGPGKPHIATVRDMMADEDKLAYAALFAPVAGIIAGALRLGSRLAGAAGRAGEGTGEGTGVAPKPRPAPAAPVAQAREGEMESLAPPKPPREDFTLSLGPDRTSGSSGNASGGTPDASGGAKKPSSGTGGGK